MALNPIPLLVHMSTRSPFTRMLVPSTCRRALRVPARAMHLTYVIQASKATFLDLRVSLPATECCHGKPFLTTSPDEAEIHQGAVLSQLRTLSSNQGLPSQYCSKCHMRRPSQEFLVGRRHHDHNRDEEMWDGFCPDISMPSQASPRPSLHHVRRQSGLCPENIITQEHHEGGSSPTQMTLKSRICHHNESGYHHECHCETVTPTENLTERYGLGEEPGEIEQKRKRLEQQAAAEVAGIMHEELLADMEARQSRL